MNIYISATLRNFFDRQSELSVKKENIKAILEQLVTDYPDSKKILFDENENLRSFIKVYVGEDDYTDSKNWSKKIPKE